MNKSLRLKAMKRGLLLAALLLGGISAQGQQYVFLYKDGNTVSFLSGANNTVSGTNTFNASTCLFNGNNSSITAVTEFQYAANTSYYLRVRTGNNSYALQLSTNGNYRTFTNAGNGRVHTNNRYVRYNNGWTYTNTNNPGTVAGYTVLFSYSNHDASLSAPVITGADVLTTTGTSNYSVAATATPQYHQFDGYSGTTATSYYWYSSALQTEAPAGSNVTSGTWNLEGGGSYASVNSSNGQITVSSLPSTDLTMTLTCSVTANGDTKTATKTVVLYANTIATPTITRSGNDITLATSSMNSTIYYTTDGSNPSSSSTAYTGPFNIENLTYPVTVKAIAIRNGNSSAVESATFNQPACEKPVITVSSTGVVTITCATEGATIRYTSGASPADPTGSSPVFSTLTLTSEQFVKAIATKTGYDNSAVAVAEFVQSGVSNGKVTLDDREDHTWTYYSGVDASVDGGDYNTNYVGKLYSPNPRNVKITYKANGGAVSINESETQFVYYKTLEEGSTSGQYPYQVISNPFSKRPNGKGFGGWKIKEGADYISGYADEATLPLDAEIVFTNLPYTSVNCTSAEIELEATWVNYNNLTYANGNTITYSVTGGTYETNFLVLNRNVTGTITVSSPCTIMMVEPDGSADYRGSYTFTGSITPGNNIVTKIENAHWNPGAAVNAGSRNLTIGRGMTMDGTAQAFTCHNTANRNVNQIVKIESGTFTTFTHYSANPGTVTKQWVYLGNDYDRATEDNTKLSFSGVFNVGTDRSLGLSETGEMCRVYSISGSFMTNVNISQGAADNSYYFSIRNSYNRGRRYFEVSGGDWYANIAGGIDSLNTITTPAFTLRMKGGQVRGSVYGGAAFAKSRGIRTFVITGGKIGGWVAAGCNGIGSSTTQTNNGTTDGDSYVYIGGNAKIGYQGRTINSVEGGNVFGAGRGAPVTAYNVGTTRNSNMVVADNAEIEKNVYGGGNYGFSLGEANIYIVGGSVDGRVFGGANMTKGYSPTIYMTDGIVKDGVYGGCNTEGTINNNVIMHINGGQVGTGTGAGQTANVHGGGYGSSTAVNGNVEVNVGSNDGSGNTSGDAVIYGDVYGGSADGSVNDATSDHTYVTLNAGTIYGSLYGGGLGITNTNCNVNGAVQVVVNGGSVKPQASGDNPASVFGCNNAMGSPKSTVTVTINKTDATVTDGSGNKTYAINGVYGGGNLAHYNPTTAGNYPTVTVNGCNTSIKDVYGGGNAAAVPYTNVTINGGDIYRVFAGGNGDNAANTPAHVGYMNTAASPSANTYGTGTATANIKGGTIVQVFGGSNKNGVIRGNIKVFVNKSTATGSCDMIIGEVYGGGNQANSQAGSISIGCTGTLTADHSTHPENIGKTLEGIGEVYGGANAASITSGNVSVTIDSGMVHRVFGGNNASGSISGTITVTVEKKGTCGWYVGDVFGGGNLATYSAPAGNLNYPAVSILNGTVSGNVYGGGAGTLVDGNDRGQAGKVTGNPQVTIGDNVSGHTAIVLGDVYGGGDAADVAGTPVIVVNDCNTQIGYLYGGGNAADVNGTNITFNAGTVLHDAFGGGHGDKDAINPSKYADVNGSVTFLVKGGTIDRLFAGSNSKGTITTGSTLTVNKTGTCPMKIREVYGGGNEADGKAGTINITCTGALVTGDNGHVAHPENIGTTLEGIGAVYGGANQADIGATGEGNSSNITLNINSGMVGNVYGGNNQSGTIYGDIQVNINKTSDDCGWYVGDVFGGGNEADYSGTPDVNIQAGTVYGSVFGGGNAADVGGSDVAISGGQVNGGVYGGCNSSGNTGAVTISLTGGQVGTSGSRADVFGGGFGSATTTSGNIGVTLNGTTVYGDLYGGSALGSVNDADANPANTTTLTISSNTLNGTIYGGGKGSNEGSGTTAISNGNVLINYNTANTSLVGLYGGANINGNVKGDITLNVLANVGASNSRIDIFGGGLGHATGTEGNVTVNVGAANGSSTPTIYGDIYGGSALGNVNNAVADLTTVNILNGTVHGNVYGGGLGDATLLANGYLNTSEPTIEAIVYGTVHVNIGHATTTTSTPTIDGKVFGCNNLAGTPKGHVYVDVYRTTHTEANTYPDPEPASAGAIPTPTATEFAIQEVYGGGNLAHYTTTEEGASTHVYIHNCDNTIQYVYGGGNAANTPANVVTIDGGRMEYVFGGGNGAGTGNPGANVEGNATVNLNGGIINYVFGGSNTLGVVNGTASMNFGSSTCTRLVKELYGGGNLAPGGAVDMTIPCGVDGLNVVFGGSRNADIGTEALFNGGTKKNVTITIEGGTLAQVFGGNNQGGTIWGDVTLNLKGGTIVDAFGGNNAGGNIKGNITVNVEEDESLACPLVLTNVFGGGKDAAYTPADATISGPLVNINHKKNGTSITGSVFGGGQGSGAVVTANPVVTIGDNNDSHLATIAGNVYGGGDAAAVTGNTTVTYNDNNASSTVAKLFGGGNAAGVSGTATVTLTSGKVTAGIYGGCNASGTVGGAITVNVTGGQVGTSSISANVHGGGYGSSTETDDAVTVTIGNGTTTPVIYGDVYGGSALGNVNDAVTELTKVWLKSGTVNGNLYGGGLGQAAVAAVGTEGQPGYVPAVPAYAALVNGKVQVVVDGGSVTGAVFGCNNINGTPKGTVEVEINATAATDRSGATPVYALQAVYGGGNLAHYDPTTPGNYPTVTVNGCNTSIKDVFGGGNAAAVPYTNVTINGGDIDRVFAGGNGESGTPANVGYKNSDASPSAGSYGVGTANATIAGGTIRQVFGGSNANGVIRQGGSISVDKSTATGACAMKIAEVYGGGNEANGAAGSITIGCTGTLTTQASNPTQIGTTLEGVGAVYGGANNADIGTSGTASNITLNINSGIVGNVYGGNNSGGTIHGTITVNIEKNNSATCASNWYVGNVFGGGNLAQYSGSPAVTVKNGTVSQNVYGGGKGDANDHTKGQVTGHPVVTIGDATKLNDNTVQAIVTGDVYGGGDAGNVVGTPQVNVVNKCNTTIGNVYGGGNAADVSGTDVNIDGGNITGMVFGGGHGDKYSTPQKEANVGGDVTVDVTGGTINKVFGGSNSKGNITGTVAVNINKGATSCNMVLNEVYGGGNEAAGNAGTITIGCTGDYENNGEGITTVYGGANAADVGNSISLTIKGGHIDNVYGGNNTSGSISGTVTVNVNWDDALTCGKYLGNVFGGGNLAALSGAATVNIQKGTVSQNVYGGGNQAGVGSATVSMTGGSVLGGLYGGCNTSGTVGGAISVSLTGGTIGTSSNRADVFGGGLGSATATSGNIGVTLNGTTVWGDLYGGSALGQVNASTSNTTTLTISSNTLHGTIYGGGKGSNEGVGTTVTSNGNVTINYNTANTALTGLYGGANINGNVKGAINVNVLANVGATGDNNSIHIFGGGLGQNTATEGNVTVTIGNKAGTYQPVIYGDIYGGSALGNVNDAAADITKVDFLNGTLHGNIYGGGLGEKVGVNNGTANIAAKVNGQVQVNIGASDQTDGECHIDLRESSIYGCNNTNGSPQDNVAVNIYKTGYITGDYASQTGTLYAIDQVFGGGNEADYLPENGLASSPKKATVHIYNCKNTIRRVFGGGNAAASTGVATIIDGGRFDYVFGGGNGEVSAANIGNGGVSLTVTAGIINRLFGGSNTQGTISGSSSVNVNSDNVGTGCEEYVDEFFGGGNLADISGDLNTTIACGTQFGAVYGGCNLADITGSVTLTVNGGTMNYVYGGSKGRAADNTVTPAITAKAADISGNVTLNLYGGTINNAFGGSNINGNIGGNITVNVIDAEVSPCELDITNIYGAGNLTDYTPDNSSISYPQVNIKHIKSGNSIHGNVYGGGKQAAVTANPVVNIGNGTAGQLATISGKVFGGGDEAGITGTTTVNMLIGSVGLGLYGGCNTSGTVTGAIAVNVTGGTVGTDATHTANVHGGGYGPSTGTGNNVEVTIGPSGAGTGPTIYGDVYGGSALGNVNGTSANTTYHTYVTLNKGTINGNLYGGGLGQTSPTAIAAMVYSPVQVTVNNGTVTGAVYGCNNSNGAPQSTVNVDIYGTDQPATGYAIGKVFGGGNQAAYGSTPVVKVHNCDNKIEYVYGGGNAATVQGTDVTIYGGNTIGNVYGGCYGADVTTNGTDVKIYGGTIGKVFGGNNSSGTVTGSINVNVNKQTEAGHSACEMHITEVYGGGNLAASAAGNVEIGCTGGATEGIDYVYGGANQANVTGDITLSITGGRINNVFGGNNTSGTISGDITVDVEWDGSCDQNYLGNVYGAGNLAPYTMHSTGPTVNIKNGTAANVYGGGKGATAIVTGNPEVTIGDNVAEHCAIVSTNVYGGGDAAAVTGNTSVTYNDNHASSTVGKLFGGGNAASVSGTSTVTLTSGNVTGGVYGGCNSSGSVGAVTVALNGGTVGATGAGNEASVYGGGFGPLTTTSDNIDVTLNGTTVYGDLYGGSALGSVNAANKTTTVTVSSNSLHGTIYGGGQGSNEGTGTTATTLGNVIINYNTENTALTGIYGGANINGDVAGNINVNVEANVGASGAGNSIDIYGGGFGQYTTTGGNVTVTVGNSTTPTIYGDLYGGSGYGEVGASGKLAKVDFKAGTLNGTIFGGGMGQGSPAISATVSGGTEVDVTSGTISGGIYGGCNERGNVVENITVNVTGGTIGADGAPASVFGGGYGSNTTTQGDVTVTINGASATVWGDVYGGSGFGDVNDGATDETTVNILNGTVKRDVFGGGLGSTSPAYAAQVAGVVTVNIGSDNGDGTYSGEATIGGNVYGCNNTNGSPQQSVTVNIYKTAHTTTPVDNTYSGTGYAIANVFGGGKNADFNATGMTATVNVYSCANTIRRVFGGGDAAAVTGSAVMIQGGRFNFVFGGGNGEVTAANIGTGGITLDLHGGNIGTLVSGSNTLGTISGPINVTVDNSNNCDEEVNDFFGGSNAVDIGTDDAPVNIVTTIDCGAGTFNNVYGGSNAADITGNIVLNIYGGTMKNVFGGSKGVLNGTAANIKDVTSGTGEYGNVTLNLYGGNIGDPTGGVSGTDFGGAFGGSNYNGNIDGNITVNVLDHEGDCKLDITNIYGSGNLTHYTPTSSSATSPTINVMHIKVMEDNPATTDVDESVPGIRGSVFGGGLGSTAVVTANPVVNIGYTSSMSALPTVVYPADATIDRANYTAVVCGSLYGGGDAAAVTGSPVVTVYNSNSMVKERIIGGSNAADVTGGTHIVINDGTFGTGTGASRGVYGGCNMSGTVSGTSLVDILGGTFGTQADVDDQIPYNIHGGGFGAATYVIGSVTVNYGQDDGTTAVSNYPLLYGDLYGGSALGNVNGNSTTPTASATTTVNVLNGSFGFFEDTIGGFPVQFGGNIYGGGLGDASNPATVWGVVHVNIGAPRADASSSPRGKANLAHCNVYGCNNAYGSPQENVYVDIYQTTHTTKNTASYNSTLSDKINELYAIKNVFGGGNKAHFDPTDNTKEVYNSVHYCENTIENVYGGGNAADVTGTNVLVEGGRFNFIFGGGNGQVTAANVGAGGLSMTIYTGHVGWYFDGCNMRGEVAGTKQVVTSCADCPCNEPLVVDNYYFGSNMATIYGGLTGKEIKCKAAGETEEDFEFKNVYAGSRLATIYGNIELTVSGGSIENLFGGSEGSEYVSADIKKYPADWHTNSSAYDPLLIHYLDSVYTYHGIDLGGTGGNIILTLRGGTIHNVFGGCNYRGNVEGNIHVIVDSSKYQCPLDIDTLYGGNNLAKYAPDGNTPDANRISPWVELKNGHVNYDVFGGSRGGDPTHRFGNGLVIGNPKVVVGDKGTEHKFRIGRDVFGGGSAANVTGNTTVIIQDDAAGTSPTTVEHNVFGGGKSGDVSGNSKVTIAPTE